MFSKKWEKIYKKGQQLNNWPWSDVITLTSQFFLNKRKTRNKYSVLELGCGVGPNIDFFVKSNFDYYGIEGSISAVKRLKKKYPKLKKRITCGDFTIHQPFKKKFNLILDRGSMTHNDTVAIKSGLRLAKNSLKPGGLYFGIDWFSTNDSDFKSKEKKLDKFTINNLIYGRLKNVGKIHFSNQKHLKELFKKWKIIQLEEKTKLQLFPKKNFKRSAWLIVVQKI